MSVQSWAVDISGYVSYVDFDLKLEGAEVLLVEKDSTKYTERGGYYKFSSVEPGSYTLIAKAQGYPPLIKNVTVEESDVTLDFGIDYGTDVIELEGFTVTGTLLGQAKAQNIQKASTNLTNAVSSDAIGQFVDRNAAEALQRLPGVTVEDSQGEGKFVIIRGADPQLSNITIDGVEVATPEEDGRRTGLNIVTVDQLERLEVSKTWTPNQKAGTIGGTVNLITRSALDRGSRYGSVETAITQYDLSDDLSGRLNVTFGDIIDRAKWDWLGEKEIGLQISAGFSEDNRGSETLSLGWDPSPAPLLQGDPILGFVLRESSLRDFEIARERKSLSGRFELKFNDDHDVYFTASLNQFNDDETIQTSARSANSGDSNNYAGERRLTPEIAEKLNLDLTDPFNISRINTIDPTQGSLTYEEAIALGDIEYNAELNQYTRSSWGGVFSRQYQNRITEDEIFTYQIGGNHTLFDRINATWKYYSSAADQSKETRSISLAGAGIVVVPTSGGGELPNIVANSPEALLQPSLYSISEDSSAGPIFDISQSDDERSGFEADFETSYEFLGKEMETKFGVAIDNRDKKFAVDNRNFSSPLGAFDDVLYPDNRIRLSDDLFLGPDSDGFVDNFGDAYTFGPKFDSDKTLAFLRNPSDAGADFGQLPSELNENFTDAVTTNYDATEDISGLYLMHKFSLLTVDVNIGARYEKTENSFTNLKIITRTNDGRFISPAFWRFLDTDFFSESITTEREYDHLLPALHLKRNFGDKLVARLSATQTISRPTFSDLIPREVPGLSGPLFGTSIRLPNIGLQPWESDNFDFSLEYYFETLGMFSISAFQKNLDGAIYNETRSDVGPNEETRLYAELYRSDGRNVSPFTFNRQVNAGEGELRGVEFSFVRGLDFLPSVFKKMSINTNLSFFDSEVELVTLERLGETVPLFRQPDLTGNLSLSYESEKMFMRLSFNRRGAYLSSVQGGGIIDELLLLGENPDALDTFTGESDRLDLLLRYNLKRGLQLFFEGTNLTNEPVENYQGTTDRLVSVRYTNPVYSLGMKWNF